MLVGAMAAGALLGPSPALAGTASHSGTTLTFRGYAGEANTLTVSKVSVSDGRGRARTTVKMFRLSDSTAKVSAGAGCSRDSAQTVLCPVQRVSRLVLLGGDGNDVLKNNTGTRSHLAGNDGDDVLIGGFGNDTMRGGRGYDVHSGRGGDDSIATRGTFADRISCGAGHDTVQADALDHIANNCEVIDMTAWF